MRACENDLVRDIKVSTDRDIFIWKSDLAGDRFESTDERFPFVVEKRTTIPVLLVRSGYFESLLSKSLIVKDLLVSIEKQIERQNFDEEFNNLIADYLRP